MREAVTRSQMDKLSCRDWVIYKGSREDLGSFPIITSLALVLQESTVPLGCSYPLSIAMIRARQPRSDSAPLPIDSDGSTAQSALVPVAHRHHSGDFCDTPLFITSPRCPIDYMLNVGR